MLSRFVSRSRHLAIYEAAQAEMQRLSGAIYGKDADDALLGLVDWEAAP